MHSSLLIITLFGFAIQSSLACNGYKAKLKQFVSCSPDNVIKVQDGFAVTLTKDCELIPAGCIMNKGFKTATATFSVTKDNIPIKDGTVDLCAAVTDVPSEGKNFLKVFALPDHCPVPEGKICATDNTKADLSKYKNMLSMAKGDIRINTTIEHDTGKTCFFMEIEITK